MTQAHFDVDQFDKDRIASTLEKIATTAKRLIGQGKLADYIPALAEINPNQFGVAVCDIKGNVVSVGDAATPFSIQSISKLFTLVQAIKLYDATLWDKIGKEPSGQRFNSLVQLETDQGIPRNPFINAGALAICDRLESRLSAPNYQLTELLKSLSDNPAIKPNVKVARSELAHGSRNAAMAYLMKAFNNFHNPVEKVLESYCHHCAIEMSCIDLAKATLFLANSGTDIKGNVILSREQTVRVNALMATCGLYDASGEFAYQVGLPGKSGVGGGIVAIHPKHFSICVWSPELDEFGNSKAGIEFLRLLTDELGISIY